MTKNAVNIIAPNKIVEVTESAGPLKSLTGERKEEPINLGSTINVTNEPIKDIPIRSNKEENEKRRIKKGIFFFSLPRIAKSLKIILKFYYKKF